MSVYDVLMERGFIEQTTHESEIKELLENEKATFYIGFDPTADSLTVGHFLPVMAMAHMQRAGHRPIVLIGGGTTMVGDPTGKTDMRKMMTVDQIGENANIFKGQLSKFIDFTDDKAIMVNNADWLLDLNYVEFLREVGVHFSVNRMLTADCYKSRMEKGLTFLEFNYMLMQSYDFLALNREYNCTIQMGGNDQWSNILGGVELIRRTEQKPAFGMTFKLLTTSEGKKMGKTEKGAVWLDPKKTTPYEFYQYWRNVEDAKVEECLGLLTFLPMDEVRRLGALQDAEINKAKEVLAFEITKIVHGEALAKEAMEAAKALFTGGAKGGSIPTTLVTKDEFAGEGMDIISALQKAKLVPTRSEGRRMVQQGGVRINDVKVEGIDRMVTDADFTEDGTILLKKGKKGYHQFQLEQ
ncbi:tyrosine--tRNA ligase [Vallitalea pronyensis]|uniref:Tyrosine--tRNA ligase n=1 Tax=Vallitalea pronyensis TaxID=1348613 RepID=A0A8J8ML65_9FIRM|nr:tyrosine--tRNA ligase [Vallitalea pronyensis]